MNLKLLVALAFAATFATGCCSEARGCVVPAFPTGGGSTIKAPAQPSQPAQPPAMVAPDHPEDPYFDVVDEWPLTIPAGSYAEAEQECADLAWSDQAELISVTDNGDGTYTCKIRTYIKGDSDVRGLN